MDNNGFRLHGEDDPTGIRSGSLFDRRNSDRYRAICRIARITRRDDTGLWRVRNISDDGLMLSADIAVKIGETLEIALSETITVYGKVVWTDRGRCGVGLDTKIDAAATLRALAVEQRSERYRALRLPVEAEAILVLADRSLPIDLVDVSPQGAGYSCVARLEPGSELDIVLPGGALRRHAIVRWSRGTRGGLWFTQPLERGDLESMAQLSNDPGRARPDAHIRKARGFGIIQAAMTVWPLVRKGVNGGPRHWAGAFSSKFRKKRHA